MVEPGLSTSIFCVLLLYNVDSHVNGGGTSVLFLNYSTLPTYLG